MNWTDLKDGDVVYLWANTEVVPKGYMELHVRWENGYPIGREPGDHLHYRLDKWWPDCERFAIRIFPESNQRWQ